MSLLLKVAINECQIIESTQGSLTVQHHHLPQIFTFSQSSLGFHTLLPFFNVPSLSAYRQEILIIAISSGLPSEGSARAYQTNYLLN